MLFEMFFKTTQAIINGHLFCKGKKDYIIENVSCEYQNKAIVLFFSNIFICCNLLISEIGTEFQKEIERNSFNFQGCITVLASSR